MIVSTRDASRATRSPHASAEIRRALRFAQSLSDQIRHRYHVRTASQEQWELWHAQGRTAGEWEVDIEESFDSGTLYLEGRVRTLNPVQLVLDLSDSMRGEKRYWLLCSVAVAALHWPVQEIGVLGFNVQPFWIKKLGSMTPTAAVLTRLRDESGQGYTHLEAALKEATRHRRLWRSRMGHVLTVLVTDGKFTAGRDPMPLCAELDPLVVLKLGRDDSSRNAAQGWAKAGNGVALEVTHWRDLPGKTALVFRHRAARLARRSLAQ